ncbi:transcription initiation factor TFIID subunit 4-like [Neosynchiropus ocellatus]
MPPAKQNTNQGRTLVLTVPRAANPQSLTVTPRLPQTASTNIQIPPGMMLVRSEVGQLMLVSQQALLQVQQGARSDSGQSARVLASQETLDSVMKCKNFLVTLMKLASSDSKSADLAKNVRELVHKLLEGKLDAEEFTEELYKELKTTPQPGLVPFLKKSLPAVRILTADPQSFIQQAATNPTTIKPPSADAAPTPSTKANWSDSETNTVQNLCLQKQPTVFYSQAPHAANRKSIHREDDDINDVTSMAGVNLGEENARILTSMVGQVVRSCQDQPFLNPNAGLGRILQIGRQQGVNEVHPEVVSLVSYASQEFLRGLLEKVTTVAQHRKVAIKDDPLHAKVSDVRGQLRFLEEVEALKKRRNDEEEKEMLLRLARSRSNLVDPLQQQQLKQRAKELQQLEQAQLQKREANSTALAAIGPRKKRPLTLTETNQVSLQARQSVPRVTRVVLRDLLVCMEQEPFLRHSLTLYKAML